MKLHPHLIWSILVQFWVYQQVWGYRKIQNFDYWIRRMKFWRSIIMKIEIPWQTSNSSEEEVDYCCCSKHIRWKFTSFDIKIYVPDELSDFEWKGRVLAVCGTIQLFLNLLHQPIYHQRNLLEPVMSNAYINQRYSNYGYDISKYLRFKKINTVDPKNNHFIRISFIWHS